MLSQRLSVLVALLAVSLLLALTLSDDILRVGHFSSGETDRGLPADWERITFDNGDIDERTTYTMERKDGEIVVKAVSDGGASGLAREVDIDPEEYPYVAWRWQVSNVLKDGDVRYQDGDDYPARIYLTFDYDRSNLSFGQRMTLRGASLLGYDDLPTRGLNYIWANRAEIGTPVENPYTSLVMMKPVQSGDEHVGEWTHEKQNVLEDYIDAFEPDEDEDIPPINGVAIMTDTDDTGEQATAYYGDIVFMTGEAAEANDAETIVIAEQDDDGDEADEG